MTGNLKTALIVLGVAVAVSLLWFAARSTRKVETRRYPMTGIVVAVHAETSMASVHNDDIPGFMQPMEMDYKIKDSGILAKLKRGDNIRATLVSNGQHAWELENVVIVPPDQEH